MKFNFENFPGEPDIVNLGELEALRSYNYRVEKWVEGCKKELRKELAYVREMQKECALKHKPMFEWEEEHYKEILGA